ncbi:MAG: glycosyltransferase [Candidatus Binatia bacterium]
MSKRIWITWESQRRNHTLSKAVNAKLLQYDSRFTGAPRYLAALLKTLFSVIKERPRLLFVQNPSLVLALFSVHYGRAFTVPVIVDAHNAGLFPSLFLPGRKASATFANKVALHILRNATLTLVTNDNLRTYVERHGGRSFVLPDPIPDIICNAEKVRLRGKYNILFPCSYDVDEPYMEVIEAARNLDESIYVYMTGDSGSKKEQLINILPENIVLTGYLAEDEYINLLYSVDAVMVLTTVEDCLVCGAYEAVAAEKPMIISNSKALREYFHKGAIYVDNPGEDLPRKIDDAIANGARLVREVKELKSECNEYWDRQKGKFEEVLRDIENRS